MPEIEIDGQKVTVSEGSSVLEAACAIGKYIPHFVIIKAIYRSELPHVSSGC